MKHRDFKVNGINFYLNYNYMPWEKTARREFEGKYLIVYEEDGKWHSTGVTADSKKDAIETMRMFSKQNRMPFDL